MRDQIFTVFDMDSFVNDVSITLTRWKITAREASVMIGMDKDTVPKLIRGTHIPGLKVAVQLSLLLDMSLDKYRIPLNDQPVTPTEGQRHANEDRTRQLTDQRTHHGVR